MVITIKERRKGVENVGVEYTILDMVVYSRKEAKAIMALEERDTLVEDEAV